MSERRRQVLDTIHRAAEPVGVSEIADRLGVHPNTARFHLEALVGDGIIERVPDTPSGRDAPGSATGRGPAWRAAAHAATGNWPSSCSATCPQRATTRPSPRPPSDGRGARTWYPDPRRSTTSPATKRSSG